MENKINNTNIEVIDFNKNLFYKRELWDNFVNNFRDLNVNVMIAIDHEIYSHANKISEVTRNSLIKDFI